MCRKCDNIKRTEYYKKKKQENPELYRKLDAEKRRLHRLNNPAIERAAKAKRRALETSSVPTCLTQEDFDDIQVYYVVREKMSNAEVIYHVDHIVPLNNESVCGLHVPWNLQILSASDNIQKGNKFAEEIAIYLSADYYRSTYLS